MFSKNEKKKDIGTIMIGFTVLMFGMETMSDAVKPLADVPEFREYSADVQEPAAGYAGRPCPDGSDPELIGIGRYSAVFV